MCISRSRLALLVPILSGWSILWDAPALAQQTLCIPDAVGVPGSAGPPIWWDPAELYSTTEPTDKDPRWRGALRITHGSGVTERVALRALHSRDPDSQRYLYLSWKVENDTFTSAVQKVLVGFAPDCASGGDACDPAARYVIAVDINHRNPGAGTRTVAGAPDWFQPYLYRFQQATTNGQDQYVLVDAPSWFADFRLWFAPAPEERTWTVNMLVPWWGFFEEEVLTQDFFMTYSVRVLNGLGTGVETWPRNQTCGGACTLATAMIHTPTGIGQGARAPQVQHWGRFRFGTDRSCAQGISLEVADVGTLPAGADPLTATLSNAIRRDAENIFMARPENASGGEVMPATLQAIFRMASWGSTPTGQTIIDEGDWLDIYEDRSMTMVVNASAIPHGSKGVIQTEWHPETEREMCLYDAPGAMNCAGIESKGGHQCILVELQSPGGNYVFTNESVQRNMDFVDLGTRSRSLAIEGVITPRGALPIAGQGSRAMYLHVDMRNLPPEVNLDEYQKMLEELDQRYQGWEAERGGFADLARFMPAAIVHVYHETGELDPYEELPVLEDQSSFGFFVWPPRDQIPTSWRLAIDGADEIEPNVYRMEVSDTGTAIVRVRLKGLTEDDARFEAGDPSWRSEKHCDTRGEGVDADECESNFEPVPPPIEEESTCGGCHGEPAAAGRAGRGGLLLLGLAFLGWYGLRRRVHAGPARR
jgi:hypothetical protein